MKKALVAAALLSAATHVAAPAHATGEWWDTPSQGQAVCTMVKAGGRDWAVRNGIGDMNNNTTAGAHMVDTLISKYCPQYAH